MVSFYDNPGIIFPVFNKLYVVTSSLNRLGETVLLRGNVVFLWRINKKIVELSSNTHPSLVLWVSFLNHM